VSCAVLLRVFYWADSFFHIECEFSAQFTFSTLHIGNVESLCESESFNSRSSNATLTHTEEVHEEEEPHRKHSLHLEEDTRTHRRHIEEAAATLPLT
jgi:hypothetical protein